MPLFSICFLLNLNKNREGFGDGREPLPELQGGFGGGAAPPDGPRRKIPYIFPVLICVANPFKGLNNILKDPMDSVVLAISG